ncbi:unnamed protein product [Peronospora belbahrii]|uniref:Uncharacterized protein n=1 Tax=Peronospora belbahrii TaxID=622444 RepID=A0AAU9KM45_9STRA|nr:unnamed protein product [Peronospora belbahrii]
MVDLQLREGSFMDREFHRYKLHELDDAQLAVSPKFYKWINSSIPRRVSEKVRTETYMNIVNTIIKNKKQQIVSNQTPKVILADLIEQAINNNVVNATARKDLIKLLRQRETEVASDVVSSTDKTVGHEV